MISSRLPGRRLGALLPALLLSACSVTFEKPNLPFRPSPPPDPLALSALDMAALSLFETEQRIAARRAHSASRYREAQSHWAAVLTLRPADAEAQQGRLAAISAAQAAAGEQFQKVQPARARGDLELAQRWALETLALDPDHNGAAQALRELQLERNRRLSRSEASTPLAAMARRMRPSSASSDELEHASLLADAGEVDGALQLLLPLATRPDADVGLRSRVCSLLVQQARARMAGDRKAALNSLERCLQWQPRHAEAVKLAQALRSGSAP